MNQYARVALKTMEISDGTNPEKAWQQSAEMIIKSESGRKKACERTTFLGMCEAGLLKGIEKGEYLKRPSKNKDYAIKAIDLLKENETLKEDKALLWKLCTNSERKPNAKIEVILALYNAGYVI